MKHLWPAVKARWNASREMVEAGGPLYRKLGPVKPCTHLMTRMAERLDTFGSDIEKWELRFRFLCGETARPDTADRWIEAVTATFKDANFKMSGFNCAGTWMTETSGPDEEEGSFDAQVTFEVIMQRKTLLPVVRGS